MRGEAQGMGACRAGFVTLLLAGSVLSPALFGGLRPLDAQEPPPETPKPFTFRGEVRDHTTEFPIEGAIIQIAELGQSAVTDRNGYFEFPGLVPDHYTFVTASFGYETNREPSDIGYGAIMLVRLNPMAIEVRGIEVRVERLLHKLEVRRLSTPLGVTAFDRATMESSLELDVGSFVEGRTGLDTFRNALDQYCVRTRGQNLLLRAFLDEVPVNNGFLGNLRPSDLAMVEVYRGLATVRMYTKDFLDRAADTGFSPMPIDLMEKGARPCPR